MESVKADRDRPRLAETRAQRGTLEKKGNTEEKGGEYGRGLILDYCEIRDVQRLARSGLCGPGVWVRSGSLFDIETILSIKMAGCRRVNRSIKG